MMNEATEHKNFEEEKTLRKTININDTDRSCVTNKIVTHNSNTQHAHTKNNSGQRLDWHWHWHWHWQWKAYSNHQNKYFAGFGVLGVVFGDFLNFFLF